MMDKPSYTKEQLVQAVSDGQEAILQIIGEDSSRIDEIHDDGRTLLQIAICEKNNKIVQFLLDQGASVHLEGRDYKSLHLAAEKGHEDILKFLIKATRTKRVDCRDFEGNTLLHSAAVNGNVSVVNYLLDVGADIDAMNDSEQIVLIVAMRAEQVEIVKLLLERGCRVDWTLTDYSGMSLLHEAVEIGNKGILQLFLDHQGGLEVYVRNSFKQTALHVACDRGNVDFARTLLNHGARVDVVDVYGNTTLHNAFQSGNLDVFKLIIDSGVDVDATNNSGKTVLHMACANDREVMVKILLDSGARVNGWEKPLWYVAVERKSAVGMKILTLLLDHGCDVNSKTCDEKTLLHWLYNNNGHIDTFKTVIERGGADINILDGFKQTILHRAVKNGAIDLCEYLIEHGCDVNFPNFRGETTLHIACAKGEVELIKCIVESGAEIDARDVHGWSPLMLACDKKDNKITCQLLLDYGASVIDVDKLNWKSCAEIIVRHVVKLKSMKLQVPEKILSEIEKDDGSRALKIKCEEELEKMLSNELGVQLWRLLTAKNRCLANFAPRSKEIFEFLQSNECKVEYPNYSNLLKNRVQKGHLRRIMLDKVQYFFKAVAESEGNEHLPKLPVLCVHEIFSYFYDKDLKNLIKVCDPHNFFFTINLL